MTTTPTEAAPTADETPEPASPLPLGEAALRQAIEANTRGDVPEVVRDLLLRSLWRPTDPALVSKLPKGNTMLDYLGHADTTRVIAEVDPLWEWWPWPEFAALWGEEVVARDESGYPRRLYIKLTVLGVTRPGVGTVEKGKSDPEKELIGDAIRNAAMRFGIGADLWSKAQGELDSTAGSHATSRRGGGAKDWYATSGWDGGVEEHDRARENLLSRLKALDPERVAAFRSWREAKGYKLGGEASTHDEWADMLAKAKELQSGQKAGTAVDPAAPAPGGGPVGDGLGGTAAPPPVTETPPVAPQEPSGPDTPANAPQEHMGEMAGVSETPSVPDRLPLPDYPEFHDNNDGDDEEACPVCLGPNKAVDPECWACEGRGTLPAGQAPRVEGQRACELCGSTRAELVEVAGVTRCANATSCKKRREARSAPAAT